MFVRALTTAEFDVTEMSFARFILNTALGTTPYIGIPIFPSRTFRHSAIYIRTDRGINKPADLRGRTIGVREYANTASLVARGMLFDEYGLDPRSVHWRVGDVDHIERVNIKIPSLPAEFDVKAVPSGNLLNSMLKSGEIDALIDFQPPACFVESAPCIGRLFPDYFSAERDYFTRMRIFPIMHLMVIRKTIASQHPALALNILRAFDTAKAISISDLNVPGAPKISLPWVSEYYADAIARMGEDFWPYGLKPNVETLQTFLRYHHEQGLSKRLVKPEELFAPETLETFKI
jgi:4,5-dihydroxyphthalate decarboxylase